MPLSLLLVVACSKSGDIIVEELVGADGVSITRVALYQGPEIVLAEGGEAVATTLPVVAGRDALVRVFYTSEGRAGEAVTGVLELASGESWEVDLTLAAASDEDDLSSTLNFTVPGEHLTDSLDYRVSIVELGVEGNPGAVHPDSGFEAHPTELDTVFRVTVVPFRYDADGSGRVPDTSPAGVAALADRFRQLYPISDVEITVHDPIPWPGVISPNGAGWQEVGFAVYQLRQTESAANDEYYYAMFSPAETTDEFCRAGCLLGVTLLNDTPSDTGDPTLRLALGVGFPDVVADTMLHELGHSMGRSHAPCGPGVDPGSIDTGFPYSDGGIGVLSYDLVNAALVDTSYADVMSYCDPQWISDYTYGAMFDRMDAIRPGGQSRAAQHPTTAPGTLVFVDGDGGARWAHDGVWDLPQGVGEPVSVALHTPRGSQAVGGELIRYDHLPGGWLVLPVLDDDVGALGFVVDGAVHEVTR